VSQVLLYTHPQDQQGVLVRQVDELGCGGGLVVDLLKKLFPGGACSHAGPQHPESSLPEQDNNPSRLLNKYLDSVADHKVRHHPTSNLPFHPIVLSLGGMMNGSTTKVFASWKQVMTRGTYNLMLKRLSLCLLQARVRSFVL
jgi:hypothetical protein